LSLQELSSSQTEGEKTGRILVEKTWIPTSLASDPQTAQKSPHTAREKKNAQRCLIKGGFARKKRIYRQPRNMAGGGGVRLKNEPVKFAGGKLKRCGGGSVKGKCLSSQHLHPVPGKRLETGK